MITPSRRGWRPQESTLSTIVKDQAWLSLRLSLPTNHETKAATRLHNTLDASKEKEGGYRCRACHHKQLRLHPSSTTRLRHKSFEHHTPRCCKDFEGADRVDGLPIFTKQNLPTKPVSLSLTWGTPRLK